MKKYAELVFNLPINKSFFYSIKDIEGVEFGKRVIVSFHGRSLMGYVIGVFDNLPDELAKIKLLNIYRVVDKRPVFDELILSLAKWVSSFYLSSLGESLASMIPGGRRGSEFYFDIDSVDSDKKALNLSAQQVAAIDTITKTGKGMFYLYGVTGSGKTEVYLQIARHVFGMGRGVIYLVPEISLTHQVVERFAREFGDTLVVLHSGLTPSQRLNNWFKLMDGRARISIGARSTVFAPVKDLGLIILDEEHEASYKSNTSPRYHARQVAMYRTKQNDGILLMGSATPSVESYFYMKKREIVELRLPKRLSGGKMPEIEIVDMRREKSILSAELVRAIEEIKKEGKQTILFLNRRGFAYHFFCHSCGYEMKCKNCSVPMTFHKSKNLMICHYCGYKEKPIEKCPVCGSLDVGYTGFGTERVEEEIARIFPDLRVSRVDTDSVRRKNVLKDLLNDFRKGKIDLLLGTQMVAKGLNFPGVKLVGIVLVDTDLQLPDFRSQEKTFQLIVQVSGRAGRMVPDGRVIIQTYRPDSDVILMAKDGRSEEFYKRELDLRYDLKFPPFYRLIRMVFRGRDHKSVVECANRAKQILNSYFFQKDEAKVEIKEDNLEILGPVEAPISIIARNYRYQIIIRGKGINYLRRGVKVLQNSLDCSRGVYMEVDIDPVTLL